MKRFYQAAVAATYLFGGIASPAFAGETYDSVLSVFMNEALLKCSDSSKVRRNVRTIMQHKALSPTACINSTDGFVSLDQVKAYKATVGLSDQKQGVVPLSLMDWDGDVVVAGLPTDSEAFRLGIRVGDVVENVSEENREERCRPKFEGKKRPRPKAADRTRCLSGLQDRTVEVEFEGKGSFDLIREYHVAPSVFAYRDGNMTYVRATTFTTETIDDLLSAVETADVVVLDLRGNEGGVVTGVEKVGATMVHNPEDTILVDQLVGGLQKVITAEGAEEYLGMFTDKTIAVLTDENTASIAEIIAAMLQSLRSSERHVMLFGQETFGKRTKQKWYNVPSKGIAKATFAETFTLKEIENPERQDRMILAKFKTIPDVLVSDSRDSFAETATRADAQYVAAVNWIRSQRPAETIVALVEH